jgi:GNAT superfamily N-acetyltransferase
VCSSDLLTCLKNLVGNPGVVILVEGKPIAFMVSGLLFPFKGQNAVLVPEYCHASVTEDKDELYRLKYMHLAGTWVGNGRHIHIISHFVHDRILRETLYQLGYGAFLAESLRDLSDVIKSGDTEIIEETDFRKLVNLHIEHMRYYPESPIFISKKDTINAAEADIRKHSEAGDAFLVFYENSIPRGYFIVGTSALDGEGFLLQNTGTVQIKDAFVQPSLRRQGIGEALLQYAVQWSRKKDYQRLFVENETANYYGGKFWKKHFHQYLNFSLRYIDNTIGFQ